MGDGAQPSVGYHSLPQATVPYLRDILLAEKLYRLFTDLTGFLGHKNIIFWVRLGSDGFGSRRDFENRHLAFGGRLAPG